MRMIMWYFYVVYTYLSENQLILSTYSPLLFESWRRISLYPWIIFDDEGRVSESLGRERSSDMSSLISEEEIVIPQGLEIIVFRLRDGTHLIIEVRTLEWRFRGSSEGIIRDDCPIDVELIRAWWRDRCLCYEGRMNIRDSWMDRDRPSWARSRISQGDDGERGITSRDILIDGDVSSLRDDRPLGGEVCIPDMDIWTSMREVCLRIVRSIPRDEGNIFSQWIQEVDSYLSISFDASIPAIFSRLSEYTDSQVLEVRVPETIGRRRVYDRIPIYFITDIARHTDELWWNIGECYEGSIVPRECICRCGRGASFSDDRRWISTPHREPVTDTDIVHRDLIGSAYRTSRRR